METRQHCISGRPESVGCARELVTRTLGLSHPLVQQAELLVSELVTNAIRHTRSGLADGQVGITVEQTDPDHIRIEVIDNGPKPGGPIEPTVLPLDLLRGHGYGLIFVADAAHDWGLIHHANGYCSVWVILRKRGEHERSATNAA